MKEDTIEMTIEELIKLLKKASPADEFEFSLVEKIDKETDKYERLVRNDFDELASQVWERVELMKRQLEMYRNLKEKYSQVGA